MRILYLPLDKKETVWGIIIAVLYLTVGVILEWLMLYPALCVFLLLCLAAALFLTRRFWLESLRNIPLTGKQLIWKPLLGTLGCRVLCLFIHDLFLLLGSNYFVGTEWGPMLWDIRAYFLEIATEDCFWPIAIAVVLLMPILEEFIFRGVILGSLYPRHSITAVLLSVALFTLFHALPYIGKMEDMLYIGLYAFQYIPMGLLLTWLYISTDSIIAPILMHIIINYMLVF